MCLANVELGEDFVLQPEEQKPTKGDVLVDGVPNLRASRLDSMPKIATEIS